MHYYRRGAPGWSPHMSPALKVLMFSSELIMILSFIFIALSYNLTNLEYPFAFGLSCGCLLVSIVGLLLYWNKYLAYRLDPSAANDPWIRSFSVLLFITGALSLFTVVAGPVFTPEYSCVYVEEAKSDVYFTRKSNCSKVYSIGWTIMVGIAYTLVSFIGAIWLRNVTNSESVGAMPVNSINQQHVVYVIRGSTPVVTDAYQPQFVIGQSPAHPVPGTVTHISPPLPQPLSILPDGYQLPYGLDEPPSYAEISQSPNSITIR